MSATVPAPIDTESWLGLRLSADEFLALPENHARYELVDGVVVMSPSPTARHQAIALEIARQIANYCAAHAVGFVLGETDVHLGEGVGGGDIVYRPDVVFFAGDRSRFAGQNLAGVPDLVVEVLSGSTRRFDTETKRQDYERFGVREYWLVDPDGGGVTFLRQQDAAFVEVSAEANFFRSEAISGFALDLAQLRRILDAWS